MTCNAVTDLQLLSAETMKNSRLRTKTDDIVVQYSITRIFNRSNKPTIILCDTVLLSRDQGSITNLSS